jgi:O-antigen/teichoic acid export membrane protein
MGINVFLGMLNYRIDSLILIGLLGPAAFGVYSIAVAVGELHFMISRSVTTAVTRDIGAQDRAASAAIVARVVRTCTALVGAVALVAFAVGPTLIAVVYGSRFSGAGLPLRLLLPGIVAFATMGTFASFFHYQLGRPAIVAYINVAMIAVQAAGCFVLVPVWGLGGAALASSATYIVGAMLNTCWFCRVTGTRAADLWLVRAQDLLWIKREVARLIAPRGYGASRPSTLATSPDRERTPILTKMRFK